MMSRPTLGGVLISLILHAALFYVFHALRFEFRREEPKFISLNFVEASESPFPELFSTPPLPREGTPHDEDIVRLPESRFYKEEAPIPGTRRESGEMEIVGHPPAEPEMGEKRELPFTISGEVSKRGILWKELPQYPAGLQREVTLRFRFFVSSDGTVHSIIPLQKGDPELEEITIAALHKWKFTPLPPPSQEVQEGVITFIYKLE